MPRATAGTLVQCDPSIKAIISKINEENGGLYISEDIDDETCLINTKKLDELKQKLKDASKTSSHCRISTDSFDRPSRIPFVRLRTRAPSRATT
ncbi:hypothetical protein E4T49_08208 [Aureobasidium sp. EXF-10728]|nr:hypothetical protein E4T49_08208 [Aureobasidium sp. EXF-10728]